MFYLILILLLLRLLLVQAESNLFNVKCHTNKLMMRTMTSGSVVIDQYFHRMAMMINIFRRSVKVNTMGFIGIVSSSVVIIIIT